MRTSSSILTLVLATMFVSAVALVAVPRAQDLEARRHGYDEILDLNVRDGMVYYRALKASRSRLDAFVSSLATAPVASETRNEQVAFWLNAYNALVLQTVIDHYPIAQVTRDYPPRSIRQISGAFERQTHRVAGRPVTLDEIEQTILPAFHDPRVFLVLGRGAMGSGRLRSEAFSGTNLERQLTEGASECVNHAQCADIDRMTGKVKVSPIFSWREKEFVEAYGDKAAAPFATRSPVERAVLAFLEPRLLTTEREFLARNTFTIEFIKFDWSLNDLTGR